MMIGKFLKGAIVVLGTGAIVFGTASETKAAFLTLQEDFEFSYIRDAKGNAIDFDITGTYFTNGWFGADFSSPNSGTSSWFTSNAFFESNNPERNYNVPDPNDPTKVIPVLGTEIWNNSLAANTGRTWIAADQFGVAPSTYIAGQPWEPGTIQAFIVSPLLEFRNGAEISFFTRSAILKKQPPTTYADNLRVRLSKVDPILDPDAVALESPIFDLNPTQIPTEDGGYPTNWTQYKIKLSGFDQPTQGRVAFEYYVTDAGPGRPNGNLIGLDTFSYNANPNPIPTPAMLPGLIGLGIGAIRKRRQRQAPLATNSEP